jgi:hypothetical protein
MANVRSKLHKLLLSLTLALPLSFSTVQTIQPVQAEGPNDPAPEIVPVNANGKKVLFDNTHGQTAGAADWVIDGGFSEFANGLANKGYYVKELRKSTAITLPDLSGYDVLVVGEANIPYKQSEQDAMLQYVQNGGSIFFVADHYNADRNKNRWDASEVFNGYRRGAWTDPAKGMSTEEASSQAMQNVVSSDWLGNNFGIRFRYNAIGDVVANNIVSPSQSFGITNGVSTVAMHAGSTLAILDPNKAKGIVYLPSTSASWTYAVDQGVYNGGGVAEGPYAAISKVGSGKAAFIGDSSPVEDATPKYLREEDGTAKKTYAGWSEQNDATLLANMVDWLAQKETYTSFDQVTGLQLDSPTALYSWEQPANSTEPQTEPWAAPSAGYKWWDSTTFKPGSYGYTTSNTDAYEPNDSLSAAYGPISSGTVYNGYISSGTDTDWFKFNVNSTGTINLSLTNLPGDYDIYLYNSAGSLVAFSENAGTTSESVSYNATSTGTYYVEVFGYNGAMSTTQAYAMQATYPTSGSTTLTYSFVHQAQLPNQEVFQIRVVADGLTPNSTNTGYNVGIYTSNGTQVAKVQNADGTWPSSYGYSSQFTLVADANGHAQKDLTVQINPNVSGSANLRLRQNTTAKYTEAVTIANVPAEPLP